MIAVGLIAWNLTNEIYASIGEHDFSSAVAKNLVVPHDWIDRAVGSEEVTILAQNAPKRERRIWGNEFWNRSIKKVWSVDGTHPPPGDGVTPDLVSPDGTLWPSPQHALRPPGERRRGGRRGGRARRRRRHRARPHRADAEAEGEPGRDRPATAGWARAPRTTASTSRRTVTSVAIVRLSRETFCPTGVELPGLITATIGPLGVERDKQPKLASVTGTETVYVPACGSRAIAFNAPAGPWRIELEADTFRPSEIDPEHTSDARDLGARRHVRGRTRLTARRHQAATR